LSASLGCGEGGKLHEHVSVGENGANDFIRAIGQLVVDDDTRLPISMGATCLSERGQSCC
jgi:hypothetical protein